MDLDDSGNVYTTGIITVNNQTGFCTIKYSNTGEQRWVSQYFGPLGICYAKAIVVDKSSNVYVSGYSNNGSTSFDYCTVKYSSNGIEQWHNYYNGPINGYDEAEKIAVDNAGNVYVSGFSQITGGNGYSYTTIKYSTEGNELWVKTFPNLSPNTYVRDIKVDRGCNIYLTGINGYALTIKYDSAGNRLWYQTISSAEGKSIALDSFNNVYISGYKSIDYPFFHEDFLTVKYSDSGVEQWSKLYNTDSSANGSRYVANSILLDNSRYIFVSGFYISSQIAPRYFCMLKYSNNGNLIYEEKRSDTLATENTFMSIDGHNNIYLYTQLSILSQRKSTVIKLDSAFGFIWMASYIGSNDLRTEAITFRLDSNGNIYTTGTGVSTQHSDIFSSKYSQITGIENNRHLESKQFQLYQNYPNPFNNTTLINYYLAVSSYVNLSIYDVRGKFINHLIRGIQSSGKHSISFCGINLATGVYFYKMESGSFTDTKKMLMIK